MVDNWRWTGTGWPGLFQDSVHSAAFQESKRNEHWSEGSPGAHVPARSGNKPPRVAALGNELTEEVVPCREGQGPLAVDPVMLSVTASYFKESDAEAPSFQNEDLGSAPRCQDAVTSSDAGSAVCRELSAVGHTVTLFWG